MLLHPRTRHQRSHYPRTLAGTIALSLLNLHLSTQQTIAQVIAQVIPTQSTQVQTVGNQFTIKGGDLSSDGKNRFHTFTEFNLSAAQIANFESNPTIQNIFSRISGDASLINGLLKVSGGNANLFLINPSGILFGKDARLSLPAAFTATTATELKFGTQTWSIGSTTNYSTLLGNPTQLILHPTGSIINSGNLTVNAGQSVSLIGSNIINTGTIATPGGQITLAAIPGSKAVKLTFSNNLLSLELQPIDPATSLASSFTATSPDFSQT
jgi:filamentous hemagglutinin family protein